MAVFVICKMMGGEVYDGVVKTKEKAQQQYTDAVLGQSAGIVSSVGRTMEEFKNSVTVAAHKKVTFELTYEELLKQTHGAQIRAADPCSTHEACQRLQG
ncbi:hypothetical protein CHARACLAT_017775 [Characodon lateralis]|uniref:VIT domain-containing protein n=1 Tax=Characodon lateralis TaxID=208331 RepID=A0ABU7DHZ6_9TELE|nr:hypothetical protein [Characodon lateralis]